MKKFSFNKLPLFLLFILSFTSYSQNTYYVSKTGNNSNTGTETSPFLTIQKAINSIDASGGTCILRGGTYHEEITLSSKSNLTIKAYSGEFVIMNGTKEITTSWNVNSDNANIYETKITEDIWQLFIDDKQQVAARWPNAQFNDDSVYDRANWSHADKNAPKGTIIDTGNLTTSGIDATGSIAVANFGSYKTSALNILTHSGSTMTYNQSELNGHAEKHYYYFLEDKLELLDVANEWFYNKENNKLYVWGNPAGKKIQGKVQSYAFTMSNSSYIKIENINFFSTTISAQNSNNVTVNNCLFSYPSSSKRMLGDVSAPLITRLEMNNKSSNSNIKIYRCLFEHTEGEALSLNGSDNIIEDCYFHHIDHTCAAIGGLGVSIKNNGSNVDFKQNTLHTAGASATLDLGAGQRVSYNDISNTGLLQSDGSITQITKANVNGSEVHHNWFHDSAKSGMRYDAPFKSPWDAGTDGTVHHNVMWNLNKALQIKGNYQEVYNNTCFNNDDAQNDISILDEDFTTYDTWTNQTTYTRSNTGTKTINNASDKISGDRKKGEKTIPGTESNNHHSNTVVDIGIKNLLNDPDNYDFTPKAGSVLIDGGIPIPGITDGYTGTNPDIGAYEIGDTWTAGTTWTPDFYPWSFLPLSTVKVIKENLQLKLYPNPTKETLHINSSKVINSLSIYNLLGKKVFHKKGNNTSLNISELSSGVYILKIQLETGIIQSRKIVIRK